MAGEGGGAGAVAPGQVVGGGFAVAGGSRSARCTKEPGARSPPAAVFLVNACVHPSPHNYYTCIIFNEFLSSTSNRIQL